MSTPVGRYRMPRCCNGSGGCRSFLEGSRWLSSVETGARKARQRDLWGNTTAAVETGDIRVRLMGRVGAGAGDNRVRSTDGFSGPFPIWLSYPSHFA